MAARFSRLVSAVAAGGVLSGALLLGAGVAAADSTDSGSTIPARCGQTVAARSGDTVSVLTPLGTRFPISVGGNSAMIQKSIDGLLCRVGVQVVAPATRLVPKLVPVVPRYVPAPGAAEGDAGSTSDAPQSGGSSSDAPASKSAAAPAAAPARGPSLVPIRPAQAVVPAAPSAAFPSFGQSQLSSFGASPGLGTAAPAGLRNYDAGLLFGSAFPGLRPGAPAYLGYDPASAVTTASQVQALPVDGLSAGLGVPVMLAVLAFAGVAALIVRRGVLGRVRGEAAPAAAPVVAAAPPVTDDAVFQDGPLRS